MRAINLSLTANLCLFMAMASLALSLLSLTAEAGAETMKNGKYQIQGGNFNSFSGKATNSEGKKASFTSGETAPGRNENPGFKVKAGFAYLSAKDSFTFSISSPVISFGDLVPGEPVTRTNILTITTGSAPGYQVLASEDHEPRVLPAGASIPDTTCDNGSCTETTAAVWSSPLTYGFGFRCDDLSGTNCYSGFSGTDNFGQFANSSKNEQAQAIITGAQANDRSQSRITYKINVPQSQPSGTYQNNILYIAIPNL